MLIELSNIRASLDAMLPGNEKSLHREIAKAAGIDALRIASFEIMRRSVDARKNSDVHFVLTVKVEISPSCIQEPCENIDLLDLHLAKGVSAKPYAPPIPLTVPDLGGLLKDEDDARPIVVGAGPAGMFCALYLARAGLRPVLIERGEPVEKRMQTVRAFAEGGPLNTESNIQFGEGGAGTFSDGKLTTGTKSPHIRHVLQEFVDAGAPKDILIDAKPHIGTDYLVKVVKNLRESIIDSGGEVIFSTKLVGLEIESAQDEYADRRIVGVTLQNVESGETCRRRSSRVVLATGHSARDTFGYLHEIGISMERKPFAVGVRIEHPQKLIDRLQYGRFAGHPALPAADYKLAVRTAEGRGVYSFCMCPGGRVVAAASEAEGVCTNGMSDHARDGENANSALLVEISPDDFEGADVLAGMKFQRELEHAAFECARAVGGEMYAAPCERLGSFLPYAQAKPKGNKPKRPYNVRPTYPRGTVEVKLNDCLPEMITSALSEGIAKMGKKMPGFDDPEVVLTAVEARSSSPVRIIRDKSTLCAIGISGLYPAGEGAGYAGGIMSAATDGLRVAEQIASEIKLSSEIDFAVSALKLGGVVGFPTDTVCGIGVSVLDSATPEALFKLKGRPAGKPVAWLISSPKDLVRFGKNIPDYALDLAREEWPGALTLVVEAADELPLAYLSDSNTIGLRMPDSDIALELIRRTGSPLATTSANMSGESPVRCMSKLNPALSGSLDAIVSDTFQTQAHSKTGSKADSKTGAAEDRDGKPSRVIDCTGATPKILRD